MTIPSTKPEAKQRNSNGCPLTNIETRNLCKPLYDPYTKSLKPVWYHLKLVIDLVSRYGSSLAMGVTGPPDPQF